MKTIKQTAKNNNILRNIKRMYNGKVFGAASEVMNARGAIACLDYMGQFTREEFRAEERAKILAK